MDKPKAAFYWCASCGGCEEAVVDLAEDLLKVTAAVDVVLWPVALDFKRKDAEGFGDDEIAVSFINGAVRTEEQEEMVSLLRQKSALVVAFGSCAHIGGIPGLANLWDHESIFERVYQTVPTVNNPERVYPRTQTEVNGNELTLPEFYDTVRTLDQVIEVDYYIPGCAPPPDLIMDAVTAILEGKLPERGTVLAPNKTLCDTCPRAKNKPDKLSVEEIRRIHQVIPDPEKCFLEEGILCLGPVTRSGCGERCINANMPCRGCFGPTKEVADQGAKMLNAIVATLSVENEDKVSDEKVEEIVSRLDDPIGLFYMYSLAASVLRRRQMHGASGGKG